MMAAYQLPVLLYHRVVNESCVIGKHKLHVWEKEFRKQMKWLKERQYQTITFQQLSDLNPHELEKRIILTFDDGYVDNYTILFPILKEFGFTAVIYLVTGCKQNEWSKAEGEPAIDLMSVGQINEMAEYGIEFGCHTQHHVDLKMADRDLQQTEIVGCMEDVSRVCGKRPISFSYPYGAYNDYTPLIVMESGFKYAVTTIFGPNELKSDLFRIKRIEVRPKTGMLGFARKASGTYYTSGWPAFIVKRMFGY